MVMRFLSVAALTCISCAWGADQQKDIYIVEVIDPPQWCAFSSEKEWRSTAENQRDHVFSGVARRINGVLKTIFAFSDSEDWRTDDEYSVGPRGNFIQLKRVTADFTYQVRKEEAWIIRGGKASQVSATWKEFRTNEPVDPLARGVDRSHDYAVDGRLRDFPFAPLILDEHPERWTGGKRCISANTGRL
jgi:hypothetical protein